MASTRRKAAAVAIAIVGVAGLSLASAAQLNVNTATLGAASEIVASCQPTSGPAITVGYSNSYAVASLAYETSAVTLAGVAAACDGLPMSITVADDTGAVLATVTDDAATGSSSYTLSSAVASADIARVAIVIGG